MTTRPAPGMTRAMTRIVRRLMAIVAAAIGLYLAATYADCIARGCSISRFDMAFLAALTLAALAASFSALVWRRFTPAILVTVIPCFAGIYLFEAVATSPKDRYSARIIAEVRNQRARGIDSVPQWSPFGFAAGPGVLPLRDGSDVIPLTGPSGRLVVMCQEGPRPMTTYQADEFGLNILNEAGPTETQIL